MSFLTGWSMNLSGSRREGFSRFERGRNERTKKLAGVAKFAAEGC